VSIRNWSEWVMAPVARWVLTRRYPKDYARGRPLDLGRLRYYLAWAALRRLAVCGMWLRAGPGSNGCKPSAVLRLRTGHVGRLQEAFRRWTGVTARV